MKGFIYITTNNISGRRYIGKKYYVYSNGKVSNWKSYFGSSKTLKEDIEHFGVENFSREIIDEAETKEELALLEKHYIDEANAVFNEGYYNLSNNVDKFFTSAEGIERGLKTRERWTDNKRASVSDKLKKSWTDTYEQRCDSMKGTKGPNFSKVRSEVQKKVWSSYSDEKKKEIAEERSRLNKKHWANLTDGQKQAHTDKRKHALEKMHAATKAKKQAKLQTKVTLVDLVENTEKVMTINAVVDFGIPYHIIRQMLNGKYSTHNKYKRRWTVQ
tara:strand:+ start:291 stop:1109 length:819 start_codon:yes stop_codon:yes gene_type:complete